MGSIRQHNFAESRLDASPFVPSALPARQRDPSGARVSLSPGDIAMQRQATLQTFEKLAARRGVSKAAKMVGSSVPTLWRWQKAFAARGLRGLYPKTRSGGRQSAFAGLRLPFKAIREIERLAAATGSLAAAWRQFAGSPLCPSNVARYVQKHGKAPARLASVGWVRPVFPQCWVSADGRRLFVCRPGWKMFMIGISKFAPAGFNPSQATK
jgi:transposase